MKVKVRLYGTLGHKIPGYRHSQQIEVDITDGTSVKDLLHQLEISESRGLVAITEGRILKENDVIQNGVSLIILQAVQGGCVLQP